MQEVYCFRIGQYYTKFGYKSRGAKLAPKRFEQKISSPDKADLGLLKVC